VREKEIEPLPVRSLNYASTFAWVRSFSFDYTLSSFLRKAWARPGCAGCARAGGYRSARTTRSTFCAGLPTPAAGRYRTWQEVAIGSADAAQLLQQAAAVGTHSSRLDRCRKAD
jgi:hypothetical protein